MALLALVTNACSVDHRHLHAQQSTGGVVSSNGGADGDAPDAPGGANGQGGTTTTKGLVDGCADLDTDGVADCKATLVTNPSFTSDTSDWQADTEVALSWDPKNALPDAPSGSARLEASVPRARATQCVALEEKELVIAYANAFVASSADGDEPGQAELEVSFFLSQDCTGDRAAFFETPPSTEVDTWSVVQAGQISVDGTRSVSIALVGLKPASAAAIEVYFDNVMLKARAL